LRGYERVLRRLGMVSGFQGVVQPPPQPLGIEAIGEELKHLQERRKRILEMLRKLGFKVEDEYVRREEVERMVKEGFSSDVVLYLLTSLPHLFSPALVLGLHNP